MFDDIYRFIYPSSFVVYTLHVCRVYIDVKQTFLYCSLVADFRIMTKSLVLFNLPNSLVGYGHFFMKSLPAGLDFHSWYGYSMGGS